MNGVMMPETSAGSNQTGASETCTAQVNCPSAPAAPAARAPRPVVASATLAAAPPSKPRRVMVASPMGPSAQELGHVGLCAPFAEALRVERKLALAVEQFVGDHFHPRRIFEHHTDRAFEIQELGGGAGVTA